METQTATTRHWTSFGEHAHFAEPNRTLQQPSDQTIPHRALHPINHSRSMDGRVPKRFTSASSCINCCTASDGVVACLPSLRRSSRGCPTFFNTISRFLFSVDFHASGSGGLQVFNLIKPSHWKRSPEGVSICSASVDLLLMNRLANACNLIVAHGD